MRGALSVLTAALIALLVISSLLSYFIISSHRAMTTYRRAVSESAQKLGELSKDLRAEINNQGLILKSATPPIDVLGILAIYDQGSYDILERNIVLHNSSALALPRDIVDRVFSEGGKILVIASGGRYVVLDPADISEPKNSINSSSNNNYWSDINSLLDSSPYIVTGLLIDSSSFMTNPVPGTPSDTGANYEPDVYVRLGTYSTGILANTISVTYGSGYHTYYFYNKPQGFLILIPTVVNRSNNLGQVTYAFHMYAEPLVCPLQNIDIFRLHVSFKPVIFAVLPVDYLRTYLVTKSGNIMYLGQYQNAVAKALYYSSGQASSATLESYYYVLNSQTYYHVETYDNTLFLRVDFSNIMSSVPSSISEVVVLAGIQGYVSYSWQYGGNAQLTSPYAKLVVGIYNLSKSCTFTVGTDFLNKPVLINIHIPNVKPVVTSPSGNVVQLFRPANVESSTYERLLWFNATESGSYTIKLIEGTVDDFALKEVPVSGKSYEISIESTHNIKKTYELSKDSTEKYVIDSSSGSLILKYSLTHFFEGYVYWWSSSAYDGPSVTYANVPSKAQYRITVKGSANCDEVTYGWYQVTSNLYQTAFIYASGRCRKSLYLYSSYNLATEKFTFYSRVYTYGSWYPDYKIELMVDDTQVLSVGTYGDLKGYYTGSTVYVGLLDLRTKIKTIFAGG